MPFFTTAALALMLVGLAGKIMQRHLKTSSRYLPEHFYLSFTFTHLFFHMTLKLSAFL
jgi:hypothetical protein